MTLEETLNDIMGRRKLEDEDGRLKCRSELKPVKARQEHMAPVPGAENKPLDVNVNLHRERVPLSDDVHVDQTVIGEARDDKARDDEREDDLMPDDEDLMPDDEDLMPDDEDLMPDEGGEAEGEKEDGTPQGSGYDLKMAKGQLDGILEKWMDIAGTYPDGSKRDEFMEIGERLREISGVLQRDFLE